MCKSELSEEPGAHRVNPTLEAQNTFMIQHQQEKYPLNVSQYFQSLGKISHVWQLLSRASTEPPKECQKEDHSAL